MMNPHLSVLELGPLVGLLVGVSGNGRLSANGLEEKLMTAAQRWASFDLAEVEKSRQATGRAYYEFLRVPALNAGLYRLAAGAVDPQTPHPEDEVYFVVEGHCRMTLDGEEIEVSPGQVLYVKAGIDHLFHSITEDLVLWVMFSAAASE